LDGSKVVVKGVEECGICRLLVTIKPPSYCSNHNALFVSVVGVLSKKENNQSLGVWHKRLSHVHHNMIKQMEAKDMVDGLVISGSGEDPPFV
jgi:hypothetical protein